MRTELMVALIAASAATLGALISICNAVFTSRQAKRTQEEVERLKYDLGRASASAVLGDNHFVEITKSLQEAIRVTQRAKNNIQLILTAVGDSLDTPSAVALLREAREQAFSAYEERHALLNDEERQQFHRGKNKSREVEQFLEMALRGKRYASELRKEQILQMFVYRSDLDDHQMALQGCLTARIAQKVSSPSQEA